MITPAAWKCTEGWAATTDEGDLVAPERHGASFVRCGDDDCKDATEDTEDEREPMFGWAHAPAAPWLTADPIDGEV